MVAEEAIGHPQYLRRNTRKLIRFSDLIRASHRALSFGAVLWINRRSNACAKRPATPCLQGDDAARLKLWRPHGASVSSEDLAGAAPISIGRHLPTPEPSQEVVRDPLAALALPTRNRR